MLLWQDASAQLSYRDSDSHPRAFGVLTAWLSSERGAKPAALERDRLDVTLKKATPLQVSSHSLSFSPSLPPSPLPSLSDGPAAAPGRHRRAPGVR